MDWRDPSPQCHFHNVQLAKDPEGRLLQTVSGYVTSTPGTIHECHDPPYNRRHDPMDLRL